MAAVWPPSDLPQFEIARGASEYPLQLAMTPDPPEAIYGYGDPAALAPGLAVVGARRATPYGLSAAHTFAGWAARAGYGVISGAALGCDQAAHRAALESGGRTIAVLGCGADIPYPRGAGTLLHQIASSGAVISELSWNHPPTKWTFRARNRIIAGLAGALLVVEAGLPSGTFITADRALDAGRDVLVVPGSILAPECRGANRLLRQGATPITDVSELASALEATLGPARVELDQPKPLTATEHADPMLAALRANPMRPDDAARALELDIVATARRIGSLEALGLIARYPDGRYGPC